MTNIIKFIRETLQVSQLELAEKFNIPIGSIQSWEHETRRPPAYVPEMMIRICQLESELRDRDKQYNKLLDYVKTSICPTCDNCCSLCPVLESNFVQCCCCGESIPLLTAHTDLEGDYICRQCEEEGAE